MAVSAFHSSALQSLAAAGAITEDDVSRRRKQQYRTLNHLWCHTLDEDSIASSLILDRKAAESASREKILLADMSNSKFPAFVCAMLWLTQVSLRSTTVSAFVARTTAQQASCRLFATTEADSKTADAPKVKELPVKYNMEEIVSLCKRRGIIFPSSEIYNGYAGFYDYGPLGSELKKNVKDAWWKTFVTQREDVVGLDSSIIHNPKTWKSSGTYNRLARQAIRATSAFFS